MRPPPSILTALALVAGCSLDAEYGGTRFRCEATPDCPDGFTCVADEKARNRLVSLFDWETTLPEYALGYRFDIVLRGREATPMETRR